LESLPPLLQQSLSPELLSNTRCLMSVLQSVSPVLLIPALVLSGLVFPGDAAADTRVDRARVVTVDPVYVSVDYSVPVEQCRLEDVPVDNGYRNTGYRSYTGPILGAIIGGAIGNAVGHNKTNKKVGTAVGAILGGTIGRDVQRRHAEQSGRARNRAVAYQTEEVCETVYETHERLELEGYDVTYRYAGQTHTTRLDRDPGKYLDVRVQVTPV
jgi:uncharacterized protein YcfJ